MKNSIVAVALMIGGLLGFAVGQIDFNYQGPLAPAPVSTIHKVSPANPATLEALWTIGGQQYQEQVKNLSVGYEAAMDQDCRAPGFSVQSAVDAYQGFVSKSDKPALQSAVRTQVAWLACEGKYGGHYAGSVL